MHRKCGEVAEKFQSECPDSSEETPDSTDNAVPRASPVPQADLIDLGVSPDPRRDSINSLRAKAQQHSAKLFRTFSPSSDSEKCD